MMKVTVKDIPVFYNNERYEKGKELEIKKEYYNDELFIEVDGEEEVEEKPKSKK